MRIIVAVIALFLLTNSAFVHAQEQSLNVQIDPKSGEMLSLLLELPVGTTLPADEIPAVEIQIDGASVSSEVRDVSGEVLTQNLLLLVDASGSMASGRLAAARRAIRQFVSQLNPDAQLSLASFASEVIILVEPTGVRDEFQAGLREIKVGGETALFDGMAAAIGQPVDRIIVLSDGADTASRTLFPDLLDEIRSSGMRIDVVAVESSEEQLAQLQQVADASGGQLLSTTNFSVSSIENAISSPVLTIEVNYRVASVPPNSSITATVTTSDGGTFSGVTSAADSEPTLTAANSAPSWTPFLLAIAVFVSLGTAVALIAALTQKARAHYRARRVLQHYLPADISPDVNQGGGLLKVFQERGSMMKRAQDMLDDAQVSLQPVTWLVLCGVSSAVGGLLFGFVAWWLIPPGLILGILVPIWVLRARVAAKRRVFESELPDFLTLVASGLRSGLSFAQAVGGAASSGSHTLARQMRRVTAEVSVGVGLADALESVAQRMESRDLTWTVQALRVQEEVGGSLSRILDIAATNVRQRAQLHREVRTLSAEGRLSAIILMILPVAIFLFFLIIRPDYIAVFWTSTVGWALLAVLMVFLSFGAWWIHRLTQIRV
jgi:tight adherence protein B